MFCHKCGKEIPDGARFCNYCGTAMPEPGPRHARPEPESDEIFSYSEENRPTEFDVDPDKLEIRESTRVFDPIRETAAKDYDLSLFEDGEDDREPDEEPPVSDDRENINDSYDNYTDDEDDRTFMDKLDDRFRRDDDHPGRQNSKTWLWVVLGIVIVALVIVIAVLAITASSGDRNKNVKPTTAPTAAATVNVTEPEKPTDPPATEAPAPTDPPATEAPAPTSAPITEAPAPTEAPQPEPEPEPEPEPQPDTPQDPEVQE